MFGIHDSMHLPCLHHCAQDSQMFLEPKGCLGDYIAVARVQDDKWSLVDDYGKYH
jgi:hypothetical protein